MRIIFTIADLQPESGGPSRSVPALAVALAELGLGVQIVALRYARSEKPPVAIEHPGVKTHFVPCAGLGAKRFGAAGEFRRSVVKLCAPVLGTVIHDNGVWLGTNHATVSAGRQIGVPLVVSPRGMLTAWSLQHKGWKKKLAWWLYQRRDLQSVRLLHATSSDEADGLRALGLDQPIAIIPNGVAFPPSSPHSGRGIEGEVSSLSPDPQLLTLNAQPSQRTALFLSRVHPKKGLLDLVEAWASVRPEGWRMVIAGGDEGNHRAEVESAIRARQLESAFTFTGELSDTAKWDYYRAANLFVLPTKSENFGIVIAEALACGVPVITTKGAPWEELQTHRCGWWVDLGVEPLIGALREAVQISDEQRQEMGHSGKRLIEARYSWKVAAQQMAAVYAWILGQGSQPDCVTATRPTSRGNDKTTDD